jgi:hypothetical protein
VSDITRQGIWTEACKKTIHVNGLVGETLKGGFPTDKITFRKDQITQIITVLDIPESRVRSQTSWYVQTKWHTWSVSTSWIIKIIERTLSKMEPEDLLKKRQKGHRRIWKRNQNRDRRLRIIWNIKLWKH